MQKALSGHSPKVAIIACEASGDLLGSRLVRAMREQLPDAQFAGVTGEHMRREGVTGWHDVSEISVMGIGEVIKHLPRLLKLRKGVLEQAKAWGADILIGVDGPDFNIGLEKRARASGMKTVHYVSPSIWAWREGRAKKIQEAADQVLCLFPMEPPIYARYGAHATFVGHPLADEFDLVPDQARARESLEIVGSQKILGLLPGSRLGEIRTLGATFLAAAARIRRTFQDIQIVVPMANERCAEAFKAILKARMPENLDTDLEPISESEWGAVCRAVRLVDGRSHEVMLASDALIMASGTAALEGLLAQRPMVVAYKVSGLTYFIAKTIGLVKVDRYSLPNILSGESLVPELMQHDCRPAPIATEMLALLQSPARLDAMLPRFREIHRSLRNDSSRAAATAVVELLYGPTAEV